MCYVRILLSTLCAEYTESDVLLRCCSVENSWLEISFQNEVSAAIRGSWVSLNFVVSQVEDQEVEDPSDDIAMESTAQEQSTLHTVQQCSINNVSRQKGDY